MLGILLIIKKSAWVGQTIDYIEVHGQDGLHQQPNIVLLHAGTNDMNGNASISQQGNDPHDAVARLGSLMDNVTNTLPNAVLLTAVILPSNQNGAEASLHQEDRTKVYQSLIPGEVAARAQQGKKVLAVDFSTFPPNLLNSGGIHLTEQGYDLMGRWWYDYIHQIPNEWIVAPAGPDPKRPSCQ